MKPDREDLQNSYQKQIEGLRDEIEELMEEVQEHGHDSLAMKLSDARHELASAWQIAGLDDEGEA